MSLSYQLLTVNDEADGVQLLVGKSASHFGSTSTWADGPLEVEPEGLVQINPADADAAGVKDGGQLKLTSATGSTVGKVRISEAVPPGLLFAPYNFTTLGIQQLIPDGSNRTSVRLAKV